MGPRSLQFLRARWIEVALYGEATLAGLADFSPIATNILAEADRPAMITAPAVHAVTHAFALVRAAAVTASPVAGTSATAFDVPDGIDPLIGDLREAT